MQNVPRSIRSASIRIIVILAVVMGSLCGGRVDAAPSAVSAKIVRDGGNVRVEAGTYVWTWSANDDQFALCDRTGRKIVSGPLQPVVVVRAGRDAPLRNVTGKVADVGLAGNRLAITYVQGNGTSVKLVWRFDGDGLWLEPVAYTGREGEDVVSLHYFSTVKDDRPMPGLTSYWVVQPGLSTAAAISPVQVVGSRIIMDSLLGRGATIDQTRMLQQWPLPVNFFCGMDFGNWPTPSSSGAPRALNAFCCGLADLPAGDLHLLINQSRYAPMVDVRSDLWGQARGVGPWQLGGTFYWSVAAGYREAIRDYSLGLLRAGIVQVKHNSAKKNAVIAAAHYSTWGAQIAMNKAGGLLDQAGLETIYADLRKSGMKADSFIVDDKWEESYGGLEHSTKQFPHFEAFLDRLRSDGVKVGLWAAFLRCEDPVGMGLDLSNMMQGVDGRPVTKIVRAQQYYLLDVSQPKVQAALRERIRHFMRRYRPDVVKFDFGYEYPLLSDSAPADRSWAGERFFHRAAEVVVSALREENPDVVVMYYALSPLFVDCFDIHSIDDMFHNEEEYSLEANRRMFFSSVLGELGLPSYGSGGYDWMNADDIWFDNIASGPLGSLASFADESRDSRPSDRVLAKFNGLTALTRQTNVFSVQPLYATRVGSNAARASSWIRFENGAPVVMALRTQHFIGFGPIEAAYGSVRSNVKVVVASRDESGISTTRHLGIVPFGKGEVTLAHAGTARRATVTPHRFRGGTADPVIYALENGVLRLPLAEKLPDGSVIEWLQVDLDDN